jgi:uncharacterized protein YbaA (DUF1428 family)
MVNDIASRNKNIDDYYSTNDRANLAANAGLETTRMSGENTLRNTALAGEYAAATAHAKGGLEQAKIYLDQLKFSKDVDDTAYNRKKDVAAANRQAGQDRIAAQQSAAEAFDTYLSTAVPDILRPDGTVDTAAKATLLDSIARDYPQLTDSRGNTMSLLDLFNVDQAAATNILADVAKRAQINKEFQSDGLSNAYGSTIPNGVLSDLRTRPSNMWADMGDGDGIWDSFTSAAGRGFGLWGNDMTYYIQTGVDKNGAPTYQARHADDVPEDQKAYYKQAVRADALRREAQRKAQEE